MFPSPAHEIAFWNKGQLSIKKNNILKEIKLEYPSDVEVIDAFISSTTRPDIVNATESHKQGDNKVSLDFDIIEKDDGFKNGSNIFKG